MISGGVSQADSEEEWKVLPSGSPPQDKSGEGSPSTTTKETPVFMAGGRVRREREREEGRGKGR